MKMAFSQGFPSHNMEVIHDFELSPSRRPKILVQTAGHVAGATYYYQRKDIVPDPWPQDQVLFVKRQFDMSLIYTFLHNRTGQLPDTMYCSVSQAFSN